MPSGHGNGPPPPPPPPPPGSVPGPSRSTAKQPSKPNWTPSINSESLGIGIETEFLVQSRLARPTSDTLKLFARDMSRDFNGQDGVISGLEPKMESLIGNLTSLGKETHMTWRMVHDPTVETQSAPCKICEAFS